MGYETDEPGDATVRELLLCATNEGSMYDGFLRTAREEALGRFHIRPSYVAALKWLDHVRNYLRLYAKETARDREFPEGITGAQHLALAASLADYYAAHLATFDTAQLADLDRRLGL